MDDERCPNCNGLGCERCEPYLDDLEEPALPRL